MRHMSRPAGEPISAGFAVLRPALAPPANADFIGAQKNAPAMRGLSRTGPGLQGRRKRRAAASGPEKTVQRSGGFGTLVGGGAGVFPFGPGAFADFQAGQGGGLLLARTAEGQAAQEAAGCGEQQLRVGAERDGGARGLLGGMVHGGLRWLRGDGCLLTDEASATAGGSSIPLGWVPADGGSP